nr:aminotransferase class I/II-fold pyridoxal phosphate-dependent enzyme [Gammaproteobacteria bacterium]
ANPVLVDTQSSEFKITAEQLSGHITEQTRLLMLCSPSNPTGAVYSRDELSALAEVLRRHPDVMVISDDLYEHIVFDDQLFWTLAQVAPDLGDRILTVNGLSKAFAMTGWRIGFAGGPSWWINGIKTVFGQVSGGPCSISQAAGIAALDGPQEFLKKNYAMYQGRRDIALTLLRDIDGFEVSKPDGAFYIMPHCGGLLGRQTPSGVQIDSSTDLANYFLKHGVVVVPGPGFACDPFFRISIATSDTVLREGLRRIRAAVTALI